MNDFDLTSIFSRLLSGERNVTGRNAISFGGRDWLAYLKG